MFIFFVLLTGIEINPAGNRPLLTARNYLTSNGNAETAEFLKSIIPKDEIYSADHLMGELKAIFAMDVERPKSRKKPLPLLSFPDGLNSGGVRDKW